MGEDAHATPLRRCSSRIVGKAAKGQGHNGLISDQSGGLVHTRLTEAQIYFKNLAAPEAPFLENGIEAT
jgi:hypothetical protein